MILRCSLSRLVGALALAATCAAPAQDRPKLVAEKWSGEINVPDPVACSVDDQGRVFVAATTRRKVGDLDIREWPEWIPDDVALTSVEEKRAFIQRMLPPGGPKPKGPLTDANGDGSIDWKDLTVPTERLYRLVDADGDGKADAITTFAENFQTEVTGIAAGIMAWGGAVYTTIAPDVWRLVDRDGDGVSDARESIAHGFGLHIAYAGHDMHGLRMGPDGRVYWSIGDKGVQVVSKEGKKFSFPNEGCVLRAEPDGSNFEVFAHGLRNVQEVDFNELGDCFGVDNDADKPGEKERLVFIAEGSDSGWRCNLQYMKGAWNPWTSEGRWQPTHPQQPFFITPPVASSHDGPAGFVYNPGTALAPQWRGWFFLNQFPSGKMNALRLEPAGATWKLAEDVSISSGIMGIGMSWGPDGRLYFADWAGGYPLDGQGAVWALDAQDAAARDALRKEVQERLREGFAKLDEAALKALLGHQDVRLRKGAQFELVRVGGWKALQEVATDKAAPRLARLHAIWGLGQRLRHVDPKSRSLNSLRDSTILLRDNDPEVRAQTAKVIGEGRQYEYKESVLDALEAIRRPSSVSPPVLNSRRAAGSFGHSTEDATVMALTERLDDPAPRVRFHAALAIGRQKIRWAAPKIIGAIRKFGMEDAWMRHALVSGLAAAEPQVLVPLKKDPAEPVRLAALLALRRQKHPSIVEFLNDPNPAFAAEAAMAIHDDLGIKGTLPALAEWLAKAPANSTEAALQRAINANFRVGTPEAAQRVLAFALRAEAAEPVRAAALERLLTWDKPPRLDLTDGRARTLEPRPLEPVRLALQSQSAALLALKEPALRAQGLEVLAKYQLAAPAAPLVAMVGDISIPANVRLEGLRLLAAQHAEAPELKALLGQWLTAEFGAEPPILRAEALRLLAQREPAQAFPVAQVWASQGEVLEQQAAWAVLAQLATPEADSAIATAVLDLAKGGNAAPGSQLDLAEAATARGANAPAVAEALAKLTAARAAETDPLKQFGDCLEGGDAAKGQEIALLSVTANCVACHKFSKGAGSEVGPSLEKIGQNRDARYLLEALVAPAAKVAMGFGMVTISTTKGETIGGTLMSEKNGQLTVKLPDGKLQTLTKSDVASMTPPISVMPPMGAILPRRELRDVVAYLTTLKGEKKPKQPAGQH